MSARRLCAGKTDAAPASDAAVTAGNARPAATRRRASLMQPLGFIGRIAVGQGSCGDVSLLLSHLQALLAGSEALTFEIESTHTDATSADLDPEDRAESSDLHGSAVADLRQTIRFASECLGACLYQLHDLNSVGAQQLPGHAAAHTLQAGGAA